MNPVTVGILVGSLFAVANGHDPENESPLGLATPQPNTTSDSKSESKAEVKATRRARVNSINLSPLGFLTSNVYFLNYERLIGAHGLVVEAGLSFSNFATTVQGGVGYRWHWRSRQDSGFLGMMIVLAGATGNGGIEFNEVDYSYPMDKTNIRGIATIGRRWAWDCGLNVTLRVGAGTGLDWVNVKSDEPAALELEKKDNETGSLALDGEVSLGYTF
ncbi:MAG: hypothetical protein V2A73_03240 [Pseudomonadota bacterium]